MSNIFQTQIHNLRMARKCMIEGQQPVTRPNIEVGDLVLVRDHTSKCFMPKYKVDFRFVHIQGNRVEVNGKLTWYHISDIKKTDMVTKLICQLPDVDAFGRKGRLSFDPENVKDLGWVPNDWTHKFNPDHVKVITGTVQNTPKAEISPNGAEIQGKEGSSSVPIIISKYFLLLCIYIVFLFMYFFM